MNAFVKWLKRVLLRHESAPPSLPKPAPLILETPPVKISPRTLDAARQTPVPVCACRDDRVCEAHVRVAQDMIRERMRESMQHPRAPRPRR